MSRGASDLTVSRAAASADAPAGDAPTPFYDSLMSMIDATALENRRVAQNDNIDAAPDAGGYRWRIRTLTTCVVGLLVVAVAGRVLLVPRVEQRKPPAITANADNAHADNAHADNAHEAQSPAADTTKDVPAEKPVQAEPDSPAPIGGATETTDGRAGAQGTVAPSSDERPSSTSVTVQPAENPAPATETEAGDPAIAQASPQATPAAPAVPDKAPEREQPAPPEVPPWPPSSVETASAESAGDDAAATRTSQVISDVSMRAGPSKSQPVLAAIPRGRTVEVINCRAWCEVVFAGQRGWVYKDFIAASASSGKH